MSYLRLIHSTPAVSTQADSCLDAFDRELDYIFITLRRLGVPQSDQEDLAQEVFLVLSRHWPTLDKVRPMRPYLFGVAFRIVCAHRRRRGREIPCPVLELDSGTASPERSVEDRESIAFLHAALESVPLARRAVVVLHELDDVPIEEIARLLSISRFGVYARLRKGRRELATAVRRLLKGGART